MQVMAMPLADSGGQSTVFIVKDSEGDVFAYFGDTGPDAVEKSDALSNVWKTLAPFVKQGQLKGMVIEVSYTNETPDKALFGHFTPNWLIAELTVLETLAGKGSLDDLDVVVSHIKYSLKKGEDPQVVIERQLEASNTFGVNFLFPAQGDALNF